MLSDGDGLIGITIEDNIVGRGAKNKLVKRSGSLKSDDQTEQRPPSKLGRRSCIVVSVSD